METATQASGCLGAPFLRDILTLQGHVYTHALSTHFWELMGLCKAGPWTCAFLKLETHC